MKFLYGFFFSDIFRLNLESKVALKLYGHHRSLDDEQIRQEVMERFIIHPMSDFRYVQYHLFSQVSFPKDDGLITNRRMFIDSLLGAGLFLLNIPYAFKNEFANYSRKTIQSISTKERVLISDTL